LHFASKGFLNLFGSARKIQTKVSCCFEFFARLTVEISIFVLLLLQRPEMIGGTLRDRQRCTDWSKRRIASQR
jgi:hypothetical protein